MDDREQLERIRAKAYAIVAADPGGPNADQARRILSKLPKTRVGRDPELGMRPSPEMQQPEVHGELTGGDIGSDLPMTTDEQLGIGTDVARPGFGATAAAKLADPHARRELERGVDDMVTFGLGQKAARGIERLTGAPEGEGGFSAEGSALDARRAPGFREGGRLVGSFLPGATSLTFRGAGSLAGRAVSPLAGTGMAGRGFAGVLGAAAANTIGTPIVAGGQRAVGGVGEEPLRETAQGVSKSMMGELTNPVNPIIGGIMGLPIGIAAGIHGSKGQAGRDIRLAEQYGAKPNPIGGARGGVFDSPLLSGVEGSTREAGAMARRAARGVRSGLEGEQAALSSKYNAAKQAAGEAGFLEARIDPIFVREAADKLVKGERLTGSQRAAIEAEVTGALDRHPDGMTLDDFNDFRAKLGDIFGTGPRDAAHPALDSLRRAAKRTVDETEMGPINQRYHEGKEAIAKKYDQLSLTPDADPRVVEERIARTILRRGENTPTSGVQEPPVEEFLASNPKYQALFDAISLLNAKERMALGLEGTGGTLYSRLRGLSRNVEPLQVGAYRLGMESERAIPAANVAAQFLLNGGTQ